jgi:hypothetical protein
MQQSIAGGMFGMLSILGKHERAPDREFKVVFSPIGKDFMAPVALLPWISSRPKRQRAA